MDEFNIALHYQLITEYDALNIITKKPQVTELIITGRFAPNALINLADLVTEMQEIKHYYNTEQLTSRKGIEC